MLFLLPYERIFNWVDLFLKEKAKKIYCKEENEKPRNKKMQLFASNLMNLN